MSFLQEKTGEGEKMKIEHKINARKYESKLPYPTYVRRVQAGGNEEKRIEYTKQIRAYREDDQRLREVYKKDLFDYANEEYGFNAKQAQFLFDYAWEHGHSGGLHDVLYYFDDLLQMCKKVREEGG